MRYRHRPQGEEAQNGGAVIVMCCSHFKLPPTAASSGVKGGDGSVGPQLEGGPQKLQRDVELMRKSNSETLFQ